MPKISPKVLISSLGALLLLLLIAGFAYSQWVNPRVIRELHEAPNGERAQKVMILTLPSGKVLPVNYLREERRVYAAADFPWWRALSGRPQRASAWVQGETLEGTIRAITDDPALRDSVFDRLRPTAPRWAGTLVVLELDAPTKS